MCIFWQYENPNTALPIHNFVDISYHFHRGIIHLEAFCWQNGCHTYPKLMVIHFGYSHLVSYNDFQNVDDSQSTSIVDWFDWCICKLAHSNTCESMCQNALFCNPIPWQKTSFNLIPTTLGACRPKPALILYLKSWISLLPKLPRHNHWNSQVLPPGLHQQNYKKCFALSGLLAAFPVADKSKQVHSTTNLETVKTHDSPHLIYDFPISLRH